MGRTIDEIWEDLAAHERCRYCRYGGSGCDGGVYGGPNGPIYPPCADGGVDKCFDERAYFADHPEEGAP